MKAILFILCIFLFYSTSNIYAEEVITIPIEKDSFVQEKFPQISPYNRQNLSIGYEGNYPWKRTRIFLHYNLEELENVEISEAMLKIYQYDSISKGDYEVEVHEILEEWDQRDLEWLNQPLNHKTGSKNMVSNYVGWKVFDITSLIKTQLESNSSKRGLALFAVEEEKPGGYFWSSDCINGTKQTRCSHGQTPFIELKVAIPEEEKTDEKIETDIPTPVGIKAISPIERPSLKLLIDSSTKKISAQIIGTDFSKGYIYNLGGLQATAISGEVVKLVENWVPGSKYSFYAIVEDEFGQRSVKSRIETFTPPKRDVNESTVLSKLKPLEDTRQDSIDCIARYFTESSKLNSMKCNLPSPLVTDVKHIHPRGDYYWVNSFGKANRQVDLIIEYYKCKEREVLDPRTWFICVEEQTKSERIEIESYGSFVSHLKNRDIVEYNIMWNGDSYQLLIAAGANLSGSQLRNSKEISFSFKIEDQWFNYTRKSPKSNPYMIPKADEITPTYNNSKYFKYPFSTFIGVTQWHGKTHFNNDHTGIDFGSVKEKLYSMADGYIEYAGWNSLTKCLSGGNYIDIVHDNGMHSVYLHLESYSKKDGSAWMKGERVLKGDLIGTTGNSGSYNCMPLAYHLHLEVRSDRWQKNHLNPVEWIDVDWDKIPTLNYQQYPGRLSGDNPHPSN
jgi:murein DD-endopeptidase MepM/ murein hydrolase activator NlpD